MNQYPGIIIGTPFEIQIISQFCSWPMFVIPDDNMEIARSVLMGNTQLVKKMESFGFKKTYVNEADSPNFYWASNRIVPMADKIFQQLIDQEKYLFNTNLWLMEKDIDYLEVVQKHRRVEDIVEIDFAKSSKGKHTVKLKDDESFTVDSIYSSFHINTLVKLFHVPPILAQKFRPLMDRIFLEVNYEFEKSIGDYEHPIMVPASQENVHPAQILTFPRSEGRLGHRVRSLSFVEENVLEDKNEFAKRLRQIRRQIEKVFNISLENEKIVIHITPQFIRKASPKNIKELEKELKPNVKLFSKFSQINQMDEVLGEVKDLQDLLTEQDTVKTKDCTDQHAQNFI